MTPWTIPGWILVAAVGVVIAVPALRLLLRLLTAVGRALGSIPRAISRHPVAFIAVLTVTITLAVFVALQAVQP